VRPRGQPARRGFEASRYVDAIPKQIAVRLRNDVTHVDAEAESEAFVFW
jgi:hypothetical protein